jgi:hypothetical protein
LARKTRPAVQATTDQFQLRYPEIEKLLESEDFEQLNSHYATAYEQLEQVAKQKGMGKARDAKKAMKALERVADLMNYLLRLKYEFLQAQQAGDKKPQKKKAPVTRNSRGAEVR